MRIQIHGHGVVVSEELRARCEGAARAALQRFRSLGLVTVRLEQREPEALALVRCHVLVTQAVGGFAVGETGPTAEAAFVVALRRVTAILGRGAGPRGAAPDLDRGPSYSFVA